MNNITNEQKIYEQSLIWKEAKYNFAFWHKFDKSFNWDEEYKKALLRVLKTNNIYEYYKELMRFIASLFICNSFRTDNAYHPIHIGAYKAWEKYYNFNEMSEEEFKQQYGDNAFYEKIYKICNHVYYEHDDSETEIQNVPGKLDGPTTVLSSVYTASAAENFINVMKYYTNTIIIGSASFESTGQPLMCELESGGGFRICTRRSLALDGSEFINYGFKPDIECCLSIDDLKTNADSVMKKALETIREKLK